MRSSLLALAVATATMAGCSGNGSGTADGHGGGAAGSGGADGGAPESHVDLFGCGLALSCTELYTHEYVGPPEALSCAGKLRASGSPGLLSSLNSPGPYLDEVQRLTALLGDGTALTQTRERHCHPPMDACPSPLPWEPVSAQQICDAFMAGVVEQACSQDDPSCSWFPDNNLESCQPVDDYTCEQLAAALGG